MIPFSKWLASILDERESDVQLLLDERFALHFLIAWSLFESKCFDGFLKAKGLTSFSEKQIANGLAPELLYDYARPFHERYQGKPEFSNLVQGDKTPKDVADHFRQCLSVPVSDLTPADLVFLVVFVVYRYRNNMFHGSKRVRSWLGYKEQILQCIGAMQVFVSHAEKLRPTMSALRAA
jgi:hypothetical protein